MAKVWLQVLQTELFVSLQEDVRDQDLRDAFHRCRSLEWISDGFQRQSVENTSTARNERFLHSVGLKNYIIHHNINISNCE